jgi:hypothetical protein
MTPVSRGLSFAAGKVRVGRCRLGAEENTPRGFSKRSRR